MILNTRYASRNTIYFKLMSIEYPSSIIWLIGDSGHTNPVVDFPLVPAIIFNSLTLLIIAIRK
jgi:hypothetical protein